MVPLKEGHVERLEADNPFDEERDDEHERFFVGGESAGKAGSGAVAGETRAGRSRGTDRRSFTDAQRRAVADAVVRYYHHVERGVSEEEAIARRQGGSKRHGARASVRRGAMSRADFDREALASLEEMREDYVRAVKRAIVDYALADPSERVGGSGRPRRVVSAAPTAAARRPAASCRARGRRGRGEGGRGVDAADALPGRAGARSPLGGRVRAPRPRRRHERGVRGDAPATLAAFEEHQSKTLERTRSALWNSWTSQAECFRRNRRRA